MLREGIERLIANNRRRWQKLKEKKALLGSSADPSLDIEIEDIEAAIEELQTDLETLENNDVNEESQANAAGGARARVQIYIAGDFSSLSADRQAAAIDAFAAVMGIPSPFVEIYRVYEGSIVFDLGIPLNAVQRLRSALQSNSAQFRLMKINKVVLEKEPGELEEWAIQEGRFHLVTSDRSTISGTHGKPQEAKGMNYEPSLEERESLLEQLLTAYKSLNYIELERAKGNRDLTLFHQRDETKELISELETKLAGTTDKASLPAEYFSKATKAYIAGNLSEAIRYYELTLEYDPNYPRAKEMHAMAETEVGLRESSDDAEIPKH